MSYERNAERVRGGFCSNGRRYHRSNDYSLPQRNHRRDNDDSFSQRGVHFGVTRINSVNMEVNVRPRRSVYRGSFVHRNRNCPNRYSAQRNDSGGTAILVEMLGDEYDDLTFNPSFPDGLCLESIRMNADNISSQLRRNDRLILEREQQISELQDEMDNIISLNNDILWQQERNNNVLRRLVDEDERRIASENAD